MTITAEDVKDNLLTLDEVTARLKPTEGLVNYPFETNGSSKVEFSFPADWHESGLKQQPDLFLTEAVVRVGDVERKMTKAAALEATSLMSIPKELAMKTPAQFLEPQLNWWYSNTVKGKATHLNLMASEEAAMAFVPQAKVVFSNLEMVDRAMAAVQAHYGNTEVYFDRKFHHDLKKTAIRMILPGTEFNVLSKRAADSGKADLWYGGIHIANSITGENPLVVEGYEFAWWCRNGATTSHTLSSRHKRKVGEEPETVYAWVGTVAEEVVQDISAELAAVSELTKIVLKEELVTTLESVYDHYKVPVDVRQAVQNNLVESDDLTAYGLMQAITATANDESLSWKQIEDIMTVGGDLSHAMSARCEACHKF